ncbi:hypothetical protein RJG79_04865 [Mycoplasmatota bacterium WC44]
MKNIIEGVYYIKSHIPEHNSYILAVNKKDEYVLVDNNIKQTFEPEEINENWEVSLCTYNTEQEVYDVIESLVNLESLYCVTSHENIYTFNFKLHCITTHNFPI